MKQKMRTIIHVLLNRVLFEIYQTSLFGFSWLSWLVHNYLSIYFGLSESVLICYNYFPSLYPCLSSHIYSSISFMLFINALFCSLFVYYLSICLLSSVSILTQRDWTQDFHNGCYKDEWQLAPNSLHLLLGSIQLDLPLSCLPLCDKPK